VVQNPPRVNKVEDLVGEIEVFGIAHAEVRPQSKQRKAPTRVVHGPFSEIDAREIGTSLSEALVVCPKPDSDFKDALTLSRFKLGKVEDERLQSVAFLGLRGIGSTILPGEIQILTAGGAVPEIVHLLFIVSVVWVHEV
jgi:hypothetical protein